MRHDASVLQTLRRASVAPTQVSKRILLGHVGYIDRISFEEWTDARKGWRIRLCNCL